MEIHINNGVVDEISHKAMALVSEAEVLKKEMEKASNTLEDLINGIDEGRYTNEHEVEAIFFPLKKAQDARIRRLKEINDAMMNLNKTSMLLYLIASEGGDDE